MALVIAMAVIFAFFITTGYAVEIYDEISTAETKVNEKVGITVGGGIVNVITNDVDKYLESIEKLCLAGEDVMLVTMILWLKEAIPSMAVAVMCLCIAMLAICISLYLVCKCTWKITMKVCTIARRCIKFLVKNMSKAIKK